MSPITQLGDSARSAKTPRRVAGREAPLVALWQALVAAGFERSACLPMRGGPTHLLLEPFIRIRHRRGDHIAFEHSTCWRAYKRAFRRRDPGPALLHDLFVDLKPVERCRLERFLEASVVDLWLERGLLQCVEGCLRSMTMILPHAGMMFLHDPPTRRREKGYVYCGRGTVWLTQETLRVAHELAAGPRPRTMLDIGTGHGAVALAASPFLDRVVGSDIDDRNLEFARLNSDLNDVRNVEFVHSDLFASIEGKFDLIVSNPPQAVAACGDPSTGFHDHGGFMGQELVEGILEGAWSRLTERGALVLSLSSPVMADGALVERQLRRHFADRPARIVIKHIVHDYNVKRHAFYREHGIRSFLRCLVTVRKSTHFEIERVDVQPAALMASRIRVALLRRLAPFATGAERGTPTARTADRGPGAVTETVSSSRDSRSPQRAG